MKLLEETSHFNKNKAKLAMFLIVFTLLKCCHNKLVGVVEIIRHGSRGPPNFGQFGEKLFFDTNGMILTINGFRQHVLLGKWLRERYINELKFLPFKLNNEDLKLYSSATQRTIFSLTGHMIGFYPGYDLIPNFNQIQNIKFDQIPPINKFKLRNNKELSFSVLNPDEPILHSWRCKLGKAKMKELVKSKNFFSFDDKIINQMMNVFKDKMPFIFQNKKNIKTLPNNKIKMIRELIGYVTCARFVKGEDPFKFSEDFNQLMNKFIVNKWYSIRLNPENENIIKISISSIFIEIKNYFKQKLRNVNKKKFIIFSGHDTNLIDIISNIIQHKYLRKLIDDVFSSNNMDDYNFLVPQFASNFLFELHNIDNNFYVRILYNGKEIKDHFIVNINYEDNKGILLRDFLMMLQSRINFDYKKLKCD